MSYLDLPRLCFTGSFQVDVSTINNTVAYYDNAAFQPSYQEPGSNGGGWNPDGTGFFRFVDCKITAAALADRWITDAAADPVIGMALENADSHVFGKLADLDPQQQMCSEIWGMKVRLTDGGTAAAFAGDYTPGPFFNLWQRQQSGLPSDQTLAAAFRSTVARLRWGELPHSEVLHRLRDVCEDDSLSITFSAFGYGRDPTIPRYTYGKLVGCIGPYRRGEPRRFARGRQLAPSIPAPNNPPPNYVDWSVCKVDRDRRVVTADFSNCFQIVNAGGHIANFGPVYLAVLRDDTPSLLTQVTQSQVVVLGAVRYQEPAWFNTMGGIQDFSYAANPDAAVLIGERPLLLLQPAGSDLYTVLAQETLAGLFLRADNFVYRLEPGETQAIDLYATRYGEPYAGAVINCAPTQGLLGATGGGGPPSVPTPDVMVPPNGVGFRPNLETDRDGRAELAITAARLDPPVPRGYIDGQLYGVGYALADEPANAVQDPFNFTSVLVFSPVDVPEHPTWFGDVQPIMQQYANLYPIMSKRLFRIDDYDTVVHNLKILEFAFRLPAEDPNHMPVTRDLSAGRREIILRWMTQKGPDGLPLKGAPAPRARSIAPLSTMAPVKLDLHPIQQQGKTAVLMELKVRGIIRRMS
ncbi:hypothetical protein JQ557_14040 [Bradyrhizobium sp. U87765 SZCCT0131]|uniref:hypothetical protein n=1 Tax=unclassified Bradyrhizobium TaxID=2631580 RepID=UPI001BA911D2|nr:MULTISPECIES: hypothetical protein [unclassified Bradyrhizobium]MBR1219120.1 hypothetical protein [Bradyrhizobium sp. U87765 SZCCT0131]MBR1261771.1 hypothetical protein [Bradyrhizobium sp. U87765 SZCCT0134]MBR1306376.1 hypothetical protein [Bradyrhizobium sp. U87765 SZCCT0110]MBR1317553.1 hypothetical protein [Bradyrhizobium sp. U87765 SZCCT0109]MBR1351255.1 hypothetical protein [Bradyrhizobium sp. U87765 SZCCT0048]